jgi:MFS transporter, DHA1 family, inner membrane transport protein
MPPSSTDLPSTDLPSTDLPSRALPSRAWSRSTLTALWLAKFVGNMALRLVYPFNSDIAKGLGVSLSSVGLALGVGEMTGLASGVVGPQLDRGRFKHWALIAIGCVTIGSAILGVGGIAMFAIGFSAIAFGVAAITTTGHTWIGGEVPQHNRGRVIGLYETTWAVALLIGAPVAGVMISRWTWWSPFAVIAALGVGSLMLVAKLVRNHKVSTLSTSPTDSDTVDHGEPRIRLRTAITVFPAHAWRVLATGLLLTLAAMSTFATYGPWFQDRFGFSTEQLAALTFGLGFAELAGSGGVSLVADKIGISRSVIIGTVVMGAGAALMLVSNLSDGASWVAAVGTVAMFFGFEFGYVANIALVSEAGATATMDLRGSFVGFSGATTTIFRAAAAATGLAIYDRVSMTPVLIVTVALATIVAVSLLVATRRPD